MAAVSSQQFWENFFNSQSRDEWYFSAERFLQEILSENSRKDPELVILHAGVGNAVFSDSFFQGTCLQFDFSINGLQQIENDEQKLNLFVANALKLPLRDDLVDVIIEKGLFDSITGKADTAVEQAYKLLCEYNRCLRKNGIVVVFSLFGPSNDAKDMLGLLFHPQLTVECRSLYVTPAEIPTQDFCFAYLLRLQST